MIKCEVRTNEEGNQMVNIEIGECSSIECMAELCALCGSVFEHLKPSFTLSVEDTVKGFAQLLITALEEGKCEDDEK